VGSAPPPMASSAASAAENAGRSAGLRPPGGARRRRRRAQRVGAVFAVATAPVAAVRSADAIAGLGAAENCENGRGCSHGGVGIIKDILQAVVDRLPIIERLQARP
jgi:hypothetical protein